METESIYLQQQVDELSQRVQILERQMAQILANQSEYQFHLDLLKKQSDLRNKEQMQTKRAKLALPRLP